MPPPQGLTIGKPTKPWTIGRLLGSGACGSVHALEAPTGSKSSSAAYAVKIVPLPKGAAAKAGKKRKKTAEERNADLILHEYTTLQNAGGEMRGKMVPDIPFMGSPPAYGETSDGKFRYLVMERMAAPLAEVVPLLLDAHGKASRGAAKIPLGDVAVAMLDCIEAMHANNNLFVDVKPENFMLSSAPASSSKRGKKSACDVSQRIRLIDFGLVERFSDMSSSSHRENLHPGAPLVGTPAYASLNVMSGHTVSRRDDLEALGYVISELILMLSAGNKKKKDGDVLPWSGASSDDDLHRVKAQEMDKGKRSKSKFYAGLKAAGADSEMGKYFATVQGLGYAEKPDYDALRRCLKKLDVTVGSSALSGAKKKSSTSPKKAAAARSPARRRSARRKHEDDEPDEESIEVIDENVENLNRKPSGKKPKVSVAKEAKRRSTRKAPESRTIGTQTDKTDEMEVINIDSSDEEDDTMDWEVVASEDDDADTDAAGEGKGILKLDVIEGPHRGEEIPLGGDHPDTVLVGFDAGSRAIKDASKFALAEDDAAEGALAKIVLTSRKNLHSVRVTDSSDAASRVFVQGSGLPKGKSRQAFVGETLKLGSSLLQIRKV